MGRRLSADGDLEMTYHQFVVCPTVTYIPCGLGDVHILFIPLPHNDNQLYCMPMFGVRVHPSCLLAVWEPELGVGDEEFLFCTQSKKQ